MLEQPGRLAGGPPAGTGPWLRSHPGSACRAPTPAGHKAAFVSPPRRDLMRAGAAEARSPGTVTHRRALWQRWLGAGPARGWRSQREHCPAFPAASAQAGALSAQGPQGSPAPGTVTTSGSPAAHVGCATNESCFHARAKPGRMEPAGRIQPPPTEILPYFPAITALEGMSRIILNSRKGISQGNGRGSCLLFPLIAQGRLHTQGHLPALSFLEWWLLLLPTMSPLR